jgi:RNA polymerase sigma-70 factor (ECF subfamily)
MQVAYRILRDRQLAEDAVQQALIQMWRKMPTLRDPDRFEAWSYRYVVHACSREIKRARRRPAGVTLDIDPVVPDMTGAVHDRDQLERAFTRLSVDHRAVVVLHYYLDFSIDDTAEVLGVSPGTAKSRLNRAMGHLRRAMAIDAPRLVGRTPEAWP